MVCKKKTVIAHLGKPEALKAKEDIESRTIDKLWTLREMALGSLETLLRGDKIPGKDMNTWLGAVKFTLAPLMELSMKQEPDELIFETQIGEDGTLHQTVEKKYY